MLRNMKDLESYTIDATDGAIGQVTDFYFDDESWVIRYLIVETGTWLASKKVLISPFSIGRPDWVKKILPVSITKEAVKHSPSIDTEKPVSRQHEIHLLGYYGYPFYWGGVGLWGADAYPGMMLTGVGYGGAEAQASYAAASRKLADVEAERNKNDDPHLRSCKGIMSYHIHATDGEIGHAQGLLVDEETWAIRYLIVATSNWWFGHQVLVAPQWIESVSWLETTVSVNLTRQAVKDAPPYDSTGTVDREMEELLYMHYGNAGYWVHAPQPPTE